MFVSSTHDICVWGGMCVKCVLGVMYEGRVTYEGCVTYVGGVCHV